MSKRGRQNKTSQSIKEEPINFLLQDKEKKLDDDKSALELKEKQLSDTQRNSYICQKKVTIKQ